MKIRLMTLCDYEEVMAVWQAAGLTMDEYDDSKLRLKQLLKKNRGGCLVAETGGKLVGVVLGTYNGQRAWVYHLAVSPDCQGQGVGKALMEKVEQWCQKVGAKKIKLAVFKTNNQVLGFYQKLNYGVEDDVVILEKDLIGGDGNERGEKVEILSQWRNSSLN